MDEKYYGGWDNGITGTLSLLKGDAQVEFFIKVPSFKEQNYTKKPYITSRIDTKKLFLSEYLPSSNSDLFSDLGLSDTTYEYIINCNYKKFEMDTYFKIIKSKYNKYNTEYSLHIE